MKTATLLATWLAVLALTPSGVAQQPSADELARRVQARYAKVRGFTADFTQTTRSALLPQTTVESGRVAILKPSRMRWEYLEPEKKIFGADGTDSYSYVAADRLVVFSPLPAPGEEPTALLFLAGRGDLTRDYSTHMPSEQPAGEWHLALTPRQAQADYDYLILAVDRGSLQIRGVETIDEQGGRSTIRFTRYRENPGLEAKSFEFDPPRGVEVVRR